MIKILDVDGVMTDGKKYYDRDGNVVIKNFCDKDWTEVPLVLMCYSLQEDNEMILKNLPTVVW